MLNQIINIIKTERECVARQQCDRDCGKCDLVLDSEDILAAYDRVIYLLEVVNDCES